MDIKKLDKSFDICLWGIFLLSLVGTFFLCKSLKAPTFEIVDTPIKISYVYSSEDGERYDSYYVPVWKHEMFAKPKVAVYDPKNGKNAEIKPEFVEEYRSHMPESQYPFYTRWTIVIFGLIAIAFAILGAFFFGIDRKIPNVTMYLILTDKRIYSQIATSKIDIEGVSNRKNIEKCQLVGWPFEKLWYIVLLDGANNSGNGLVGCCNVGSWMN